MLDLPSGTQPVVEYLQLRQVHKKAVVQGGSYHAKLKSCRLPGQRPQRTPMLKLPYHLGEYPVPEDLREAVESGEMKEVAMVDPCLEEVYTPTNTCTPLSFEFIE